MVETTAATALAVVGKEDPPFFSQSWKPKTSGCSTAQGPPQASLCLAYLLASEVQLALNGRLLAKDSQ